MTANEIREKFLDFFEKRGHKIIPSSSLVPENDPSVLFTTAGMHPLVPYLLGEKHPLGKRLTDVQKCIRTGDIDEVGDYCHHTFFEMLGNWSFNDYFKKEAIEWSYEFLTSKEWLGLDKNKIAVSVFVGDESADFDEESFNIWKSLGIFEKRIAKLPKKNNWWGPAGETGPCGPDTEMFYWVGDPKNIPESFNDDSPLWLEIWNDVFMEYNKTIEGKFEKLAHRNVDTGMGLERLLAVVNGIDDNYRTELFWPIIKKIEEISGKKYEDESKAMRIIADHIKATVFIINDGIVPDNKGHGYILRRLIRRALVKIRPIVGSFGSKPVLKSDGMHYVHEPAGAKSVFHEIIDAIFEIYKDTSYFNNKEKIENIIFDEELKFRSGLERGFKEIDSGNIDPFVLFTTYGFPVELTQEIIKPMGITLDLEDFHKKMAEHQKLSQTASAGMFKGGLADAGEETKRLHTATHLLNAALRQVLGNQVMQKGSNITPERLRFDFSHSQKMTEEEKKKTEEIVNQKIAEKLPVGFEEMPKIEAEKIALHSFNEKYGEMVKVYSIGEKGDYFSREFCGGPHVKNTSELGKFKILKEEAVSAGIRRIKAVLE